MKIRKITLALLSAGLLAISVTAYAGPPVNITFKHLGASSELDAEYTIISQNESLTYAYASPKPASEVEPGGLDEYTVTNTLSPTINMAAVRYRMGSKSCEFYTAYVPGVGSMPPTWSKRARSSGGARCQANITRTNFNDHSWDIDFTMR
ncbi:MULTISPECIES: hypothetical protein [unclassified Halomonas]|uniref:hypothetical protein n=1 Tax=unclassified Halomonas TaxID=2609666 RepID=UPI0009EF234E|nr:MULTISPECIES: hypothetical protein [unclassified Halomonas]MBT2788949.1 hypothetical protein [Halomonas sp. ISL-106]MBT2799122.1 hypothetical protein [Halomonas sp. ISL-104]